MNHWSSLPAASDVSCPLALRSGGELHPFACPRSIAHRVRARAHGPTCDIVDNRYAARTVVSMCTSPLRLNTCVANAVGSVCLSQSVLPRLPTAVSHLIIVSTLITPSTHNPHARILWVYRDPVTLFLQLTQKVTNATNYRATDLERRIIRVGIYHVKLWAV
jgi:hypothetical protein